MTENPPLTDKLVRFQQPEKTLRYLGELPDTRLAGLFGLDTDAYRTLLRELDDRTRETAAELLKDPGFAERVGRLPFRPGQRIVALGESTTADRLSWFSILRHLLPDGVALVNLAVSGSTTTQALAQLPQLAFLRPDWVLCMLGANDAQRLGRGPGRRAPGWSARRRPHATCSPCGNSRASAGPPARTAGSGSPPAPWTRSGPTPIRTSAARGSAGRARTSTASPTSSSGGRNSPSTPGGPPPGSTSTTGSTSRSTASGPSPSPSSTR
ncbi:GDSL-type esterase/lipase family protein [Streptomyces diastatochromogenes]|nr:GDSL-type esterase/lipase family protein [Streptomyces diastatochromogenes]